MAWAPKRRARPWDVIDQRRLTADERGYDARWRRTSERYRKLHPLCVNCLLKGRVRASQCVDHIIPIACVPELQWEETNWAALCTSCHSYKTTKEPRETWKPDLERVVLCGLPGTGKSTWARERGAPYFDADEVAFKTWQQVWRAREKWVRATSGPCSVIVASTVTAPLVARLMHGTVLHFTTVYVERSVRFRDSTT
jgi:hypothetical protein